MFRRNIEIKLTGQGVSPSSVALGDLAELLLHTEKAIVSYANAAGMERQDGPGVSLAGVRPASAALALSVQQALIPGVVHVLQAIDGGRVATLPAETHRALFRMSGLLGQRGWGLEIKTDPAIDAPLARLDPYRPLDAPPAPRLVEGTATLIGRCLRVGGAVTPRAEIRPSAGGRLINVALDEREARQLARRLYEEVVLEGRACWQSDTWEMVDFRLQRIADYRRTEPTMALEALARAAAGAAGMDTGDLRAAGGAA